MPEQTLYRLLIQNRSYAIGCMDKISAEAVKWSRVFTHIKVEPV